MKYPDSKSADYYQRLHDEAPAFRQNNWLLDEVATLRSLGGRSILELGCGNGLFLREAAAIWDEVVGVDWARSPVLDSVLAEHPNARFEQADLRIYSPGRTFDVVASADFLEHIAPGDLPALVAAASTFGPRQLHKIACYDDGHSHLSILPPERWMRVFRDAAPAFLWRIHGQTERKGNPQKPVIVIVGALAPGE
jgi:cyclopropane fatty-acyl-phospholipid synthase-like methyltransferase